MHSVATLTESKVHSISIFAQSHAFLQYANSSAKQLRAAMHRPFTAIDRTLHFTARVK